MPLTISVGFGDTGATLHLWRRKKNTPRDSSQIQAQIMSPRDRADGDLGLYMNVVVEDGDNEEIAVVIDQEIVIPTNMDVNARALDHDLGLNPGGLDLGEDFDSIGAQILSLAEAASSPPRLADSENIAVEPQSLLDSEPDDYLSLLQSIDSDLPVISLSENGLTPAPLKGVARKSTGQRSYTLPGSSQTVVNDVVSIDNSMIEIASQLETSPQGSSTSESKKKRSVNFKQKNVSSSFEINNLSTNASLIIRPRYKTRTLKQGKKSSDDYENNHSTLCKIESVVSTGSITDSFNNYKISNSDDSSVTSCKKVKKPPRNVPPISVDNALNVGEALMHDDENQFHPTSHPYSTLEVNKTDDDINVVDIDELLLERSFSEDAEENIDVEGFVEDVLDIEATNKINAVGSKNIKSKEMITQFKNLSKHEIKSLNNKRFSKKNTNKNEIDPKNIEIDMKKKGLNAQKLSNILNGVPNKKYFADKRMLLPKTQQGIPSARILKNCLINSKSPTSVETFESARHTSYVKNISEGEKYNRWTLNKKQKEIISKALKIHNFNPFNLLDHLSEEEIKTLGGEICEMQMETGFDRGLEAESIEGVGIVRDVIVFLIKWRGYDERELISAEIVNNECPQLVIQFYMNRTRWICMDNCNHTEFPDQIHRHHHPAH